MSLSVREERVPVEGTELFVRVWGEGPPMLLVHGGPGGSGSYWWPHLDYLGLHRTVYAVDLRGHGLSGRDPPYSIRTFTADLKALMDHYGAGSYTLLGHSFGSTIALELAAQDAERCQELVLLGAFPSTRRMLARPSKVRAKLRLAGSLARWNLGEGRKGQGAETFLRHLLHEARPLLEADLPRTQRVEEILLDSVEEPLDAVYPLQWDILRWRIGHQVHEIRARTLVVVGEHDHMGGPETGFFGRHLSDVHIVMVPASGHSPFLDTPELFRRILTDFLKARRPGSPHLWPRP